MSFTDGRFITPDVTGSGKVECPCGSGLAIRAWGWVGRMHCTSCGRWLESRPEPFVHDGSGPDVDPVTGDEAETEELPEESDAT